MGNASNSAALTNTVCHAYEPVASIAHTRLYVIRVHYMLPPCCRCDLMRLERIHACMLQRRDLIRWGSAPSMRGGMQLKRTVWILNTK